jgi:hypothetical protein
MTRAEFIERTLRQIYGGQPSDDATISYNLVNKWLSDAIALAAKQNYKESVSIEGIGYVNSSFYTKFKGLAITKDDGFEWKISLPEIPIGIGENEGIDRLELVSTTGQISNPFVQLTQKQRSFYKSLRPIPNKILFYYENSIVYVISTIVLNQYTANVVIVSGGDSTNLDSQLNVPPDYFNVMVEYIKQQLVFEQGRPVDTSNDGEDVIVTQ